MRIRIAGFVVAVTLLALLLPAHVVGQEFGDTSTESRLFNVEMGFLTGYRFLDEETVTGRSVGLNFAILENAELGVVNTTFSDSVGAFSHAYNLVRFNYFFSEMVSLSVATGGGPNSSAAGSVGGNFIIFRNIPDDGLSSSLKANAQFFLNEDDGIGDGTFAVSILGTIGL